jgi:hypothetical protein
VPLSVIGGTFRIVGAAPDGDGIRFYPDDPEVGTSRPSTAPLPPEQLVLLEA